MTKKRKYRYSGQTISVERRFAAPDYCYVVVRISPEDRHPKAGMLHRIVSPYLPRCKTEEKCQKNLDEWARKKGLEEVKEEKLPEEREREGREVSPGGLKNGGRYFLKRRDKPDAAYKHVVYLGMKNNLHWFCPAERSCGEFADSLSPDAICHYEVREPVCLEANS